VKCFFLVLTDAVTGSVVPVNVELVSLIQPAEVGSLVFTGSGATRVRETSADILDAIEANGGKVIEISSITSRPEPTPRNDAVDQE
jgi:acyl-CoA hydrolase